MVRFSKLRNILLQILRFSIKKVLFWENFKEIIALVLCDYLEHESNCKKTWLFEDAKILFISPKRYNLIERYLGGAPYGRLCNIADDEFCWYGHAASMLNYADIKNYHIKKVTAEHGSILSYDLAMDNYDRYKEKLVITFSQSRADFLSRGFGINSVPVGPYIHYAKIPIEDKRLENLKNCLGRVVVHFPNFVNAAVSSQSQMAYSDTNHINCALTLAEWKNKGIVDNVVVCYRWTDLIYNHELTEVYRQNGAIEACCGVILNPFFLDQLKLILELSCCTTSNSVSTLMAYSYYLGKSHHIIGFQGLMPPAYTHDDPVLEYLFNSLNVTSEIESFDLMRGELYQFISDINGFNSIKTNSELQRIIINAEMA